MDLAISCYLNPSGLSRAGQEYFRCFDEIGIRTIPIFLNPLDDTVEFVNKKLSENMISSSTYSLGRNFIQLHVGIPTSLKMQKLYFPKS